MRLLRLGVPSVAAASMEKAGGVGEPGQGRRDENIFPVMSESAAPARIHMPAVNRMKLQGFFVLPGSSCPKSDTAGGK